METIVCNAAKITRFPPNGAKEIHFTIRANNIPNKENDYDP